MYVCVCMSKCVSEPCAQSTAICPDILRCSAAPGESPPRTRSSSCKRSRGDRCTYSSTTSLQHAKKTSTHSSTCTCTCISACVCVCTCLPDEDDMVTHSPFLEPPLALLSAQFWNSTSVLSLHLQTYTQIHLMNSPSWCPGLNEPVSGFSRMQPVAVSLLLPAACNLWIWDICWRLLWH